ncbi:MAG: hypothetical protein AB1938_25505 [Myxococcota bacterium]
MSSWSPAPLLAIEDVGPDLTHLTLDVPAAVAARFHTAGQYHRLRAPSLKEAVMAIASAPAEHPFEYLVKRAGAGAALLDGARPGDVFEVSPPEGPGFPLHLAHGRDLVLVATGTGFAPMRSVLFAVRKERARFRKVTALYGVSSQAHLAFRAELSSFTAEGLVVWPTVSRAEAGWTGRIGRVQEHLADVALDDAVAFVAGQPQMVAEVKRVLARRGLGADRVFLNA